MIKICFLITSAILLSPQFTSAQTGLLYGQAAQGSELNDCVEYPGQCPDVRGSNSNRAGANSAPMSLISPHPAPIRIDETRTDFTKAAIAREASATPVGSTPTEFQQFVESSVGKRLPLFGYDLFQGVPSTFAPFDNIAVPANYVIGPGDELLIRAWGQIDVDARVVVDRNGQIYLPKVGSLSVAGINYEQLPQHLKSAVGLVFRRFELLVTLGQLRSIQVLVVGYAHRPGTYTVSSLSTMVNTLFASGGPSTHGSMRHMELKRGNRIISDFDMYDLLLKGDKSKDVVLLPGDVIYIPPVGPQVAMAGSVNLPAIYELRDTATLGEELEIAGGLSSVADGKRVAVERIENRTARKVDEFALDAVGLARKLQDSDVVRVFSISPKFENTITLRGNVAVPGRYPFRAGMKVRDLIPNREFLLTRGFWNNQNAEGSPEVAGGQTERGFDIPGTKQNSNARSQAERYSKRNGQDVDWHEQYAVVAGQVELRNDVKRNGPEINWDYAVIQRIDPDDLSNSLITFNLRKAILDDNDADNLSLRTGDVITIFSQHDIAVSNEHQSRLIRLEGEFVSPGVYKANPGETLRSLITRVGGFTDRAFIFGAEFTRETAQKQQQASLDQMVRDLELESRHQSVYRARAGEDQDTLRTQMESQSSLIQKLQQIKASGRIVLEIEASRFGVDAFPIMELEDGDSLVVPHKPATVNVVGAVYNQNSLLFRENRRVVDYLRLSGGGTRDADMKHVFVIRADGSVLSKTNTSGRWPGGFDSVRVVPGDTVVVPARLDKGSTLRAFKDWSQIIGQFGLGAAAINVLR